MTASNQSLRELVKGSGVSFVGSLFSKGFHYLFYFLIARALGPNGVGEWSTILAVLGFARIFAMLGLTGGVSRYVAFYRGQDDYERVRGTVRFALIAVLGFGSVVGGLVYLGRDLIVSSVLDSAISPELLLFIMIIVPLESALDITMNALRGFKRLDYQVLSQNILQSLMKVGVMAALFILGFSQLEMVLIAYAVAIVVALVAGLYLLEFHTYQVFRVRGQSVYEPWEILSFSAPLLLTSTMTLIVNWTDVLMINYFGTTGETGIYNIALQTSLVLQLGFSSMTSIVSPMLSESVGADNWDEIESTLKIGGKWILVATIPMFTFLIPFAPDVVRLFGPEFVSGSPVLLIIGSAIVVKTTIGLSGNLITSVGRTKLKFWNEAFAAGMNVALNFLLVPRYGPIGAAVATAVAIALNGIIPALEVYYLYGIHSVRNDFIHPIVAAVGATAVAGVLLGWVPEIQYLLIFPVGIAYLAIYGLLFMAIGGLQDEDIYILMATKEQAGISNSRLEKFLKRFV